MAIDSSTENIDSNNKRQHCGKNGVFVFIIFDFPMEKCLYFWPTWNCMDRSIIFSNKIGSEYAPYNNK